MSSICEVICLNFANGFLFTKFHDKTCIRGSTCEAIHGVQFGVRLD